MKRINLKSLLFIVFSAISVPLFAQNRGDWLNNTMFSSGKINVVVGVVSVIFILIVIYLISIDRKLNKMEKNNSSS